MQERSAQQLWHAALGELQIQVNKPNYQTWFEKTVGVDYQDGEFVVGVPNAFVAEYLEKSQRGLIEKVLTDILHEEIRLHFRVDAAIKLPVSNGNTHSKPVSPEQACLPLFNPKYTFDSFVPSMCNQLAYAAARDIAQNPGQKYNPLVIYGGSGLGKTHLLHAIGHAGVASEMKVIYVNAEQYTNQFMNALREKKVNEFRNRYRDADMLLVDDIQFFGGKEQTEENFFHTFDDLHSANRQIAVTSDRTPTSLTLIPERLRSRLEWGLVTSLSTPDFDSRLAILEAKTKGQGITVSPDILELIALQIQQNIRALEGALNRVIMYARLVRANLTPEIAREALKDIAGAVGPKALPAPGVIIEAVVNSFQLTPSDLKSARRDKETVLARQVTMYLLRQETDCSLAEIGRELGGRSPATVSHSYQKIAADINSSPSLRRKILDIQQKVHLIS